MRLALVLVLGVLSACGSSANERRFVDARYDTAFVVGSAADTILLNAERIRAWRDGVVIFDYESRRIIAVDEKGVVRWVYARSGRGPGEMSGPMDGVATAAGGVIVLDVANRKLVELTADGAFVRELSLPKMSAMPHGLVQTGPQELLVIDWNGRGVFLNASTGESTANIDIPFSDSVPPRFFAQVALASDTVQWKWSGGMLFGPEWWLATSSGDPAPRRFIHRPGYRARTPMVTMGDVSVPDPSARPAPVYFGARSMSLESDEVWVLTGGGFGVGSSRSDILDVYGENGRYRHSLRLPVGAIAHVKRGDRLYLLQLDPVPAVVALDRRP